MSADTVAALPIALLAALFAGAISGMSGFGYALVSVPLLLLVFEPATVVVVVSFLGVFTNALVVSDSLRAVEARAVGTLLPWSVLGVVAGTEILRLTEAVHVELATGLLVAGFSAMLLRGLTPPGLGGGWGPPVVGASAGLLSGSAGLGGPSIVMLFAARGLPRDAFRATNAACLLALGSLTLSLLLVRGMVGWQQLWISALLVPATFVGKAVGTRIAGRLSGAGLRKTALWIALAAGCVGVLGAGWELLRRAPLGPGSTSAAPRTRRAIRGPACGEAAARTREASVGAMPARSTDDPRGRTSRGSGVDGRFASAGGSGARGWTSSGRPSRAARSGLGVRRPDAVPGRPPTGERRSKLRNAGPGAFLVR